jgi:intracellular multiplication protein IcmP
MANSGGGENKGNTDGPTIILWMVSILFAIWGIWTYARNIIVYTIFGSDWPFYWILDKLGRLDQISLRSYHFATACLNGRFDPFKVEWADIVNVQEDIGSHIGLVMALLTGCLAVVTTFRMKGDGFRRQFKLTGQSYETVTRISGIEVSSGILKFIASILKPFGITTVRKEWKNSGASLIHYQAEHWKVALPGAFFDPGKAESALEPQKTPAEWLRDEKIRLSKREGLDEESAARAFEKQLGPSWQGIEKAPVHVRAMAVLMALSLKRDKSKPADKLRDRLSEIYSQNHGKAIEVVKDLIAPYMSDKKIVGMINRRCSKHAFQNSAIVGLYGFCGPFREWGGGKAPVLSPSMFLWLKKIDRTLWYCLQNVGRRAFHVEGAGVISHFFAERVSGQPQSEPYMDCAMEGLETYLEEFTVEDLDDLFRKEDVFA